MPRESEHGCPMYIPALAITLPQAFLFRYCLFHVYYWFIHIKPTTVVTTPQSERSLLDKCGVGKNLHLESSNRTLPGGGGGDKDPVSSKNLHQKKKKEEENVALHRSYKGHLFTEDRLSLWWLELIDNLTGLESSKHTCERFYWLGLYFRCAL